MKIVAHVVPVGSMANASVLECAMALAAAQSAAGVGARVHVLSPESPAVRIGVTAHQSAGDLVRAVSRSSPDVVHLHGIWTLCGNAVVSSAVRTRTPVAISLHGMLMPQAFRVRLWKKLPYWHLVERRNLQRAALLHTTSELERDCIVRRTGRGAIVLPNGAPSPPPALPRTDALPDRYLLFLGRLHPIKNFEAIVRAKVPGARRITVIVAGDGERAYRRHLERIARRNPSLDVRFIGWLAADEKWRWLSHAAALLLPSRSESFGNVVLEALAVGTPVIASTGTPWAVLEDEHAGRWITAGEREFGAAMAEAWDVQWDSRRQAAHRVAARFSWEAVAREMLDAYERARLDSKGGSR